MVKDPAEAAAQSPPAPAHGGTRHHKLSPAERERLTQVAALAAQLGHGAQLVASHLRTLLPIGRTVAEAVAAAGRDRAALTTRARALRSPDGAALDAQISHLGERSALAA